MTPTVHEVDYSGNQLHCTCAFARRSRNAHGVEFCAHIQQVMEQRRDSIEDLPVAHHIVIGYTPAPDFRPHALQFSIDTFDKSGMREVRMDHASATIGYIPPDACRMDVVELAAPYLVDWYYKHPCKRCHAVVPRAVLDTDEGVAALVRRSAEQMSHDGLCPDCFNVVPEI